MRKKLLTLAILPLFLLAGCDNDDANSLPVSVPGVPSVSTPSDLAEGFFDNYTNNSAHQRLKIFADQYNGFTLSFRVFRKQNNNVIFDNDFLLGRNGNIAWAQNTLIATTPAPSFDLPYTVKGAVKYTNIDESTYEVYYANNEDQYHYYNDFYNEDIDLSVSDLERYFSLSDGLLLYLMTQTQAKISTFAENRRSIYFSMGNMSFDGTYLAHSNLDIAFDFETHLILYYNFWSIDTTTNQVNMTVMQVNAFNFGITPPTLIKD